jgi:hypothetical protein
MHLLSVFLNRLLPLGDRPDYEFECRNAAAQKETEGRRAFCFRDFLTWHYLARMGLICAWRLLLVKRSLQLPLGTSWYQRLIEAI